MVVGCCSNIIVGAFFCIVDSFWENLDPECAGVLIIAPLILFLVYAARFIFEQVWMIYLILIIIFGRLEMGLT